MRTRELACCPLFITSLLFYALSYAKVSKFHFVSSHELFVCGLARYASALSYKLFMWPSVFHMAIPDMWQGHARAAQEYIHLLGPPLKQFMLKESVHSKIST